jgi:hypothetical protein
MRPAFSSGRQAIGFASLLAALLALPGLTAMIGVTTDRRDDYSDIPARAQPLRWAQFQIFAEHGDVDLAFVGASQMMFGVNTPYVQAQLSNRIGRPANVLTLGWTNYGYDVQYYLVRDLLNHRRVRTIVICDEYNRFPDRPYPDYPGIALLYLFHWNDEPESLVGLSWFAKLRLYAVAVLNTPRHLTKLLHHDVVFTIDSRGPDLMPSNFRGGDLVAQLGSVRSRLSHKSEPNFTSLRTKVTSREGDAVVFPIRGGNLFAFNGPTTPPYERHFARRLAELCRARGVQLIVLHLPTSVESRSTYVPERERPEGVYGMPLPVLGIPGVRLFAGVSTAELPNYYVDEMHLNENGQVLFTSAITPALLLIYGHNW